MISDSNMDLNNIKLAPYSIAELYRASLVEAPGDPEQKPVPTAIKPAEKKEKPLFLGNNHRNILVVVNNPAIPFLPDGDLQFLTGILSACKLSLEDIALVNLANGEAPGGKEVIAQLKPRNAFLFGIEPAAFGLPMNFPVFQLQAFSGCTYLYAPSLAELENDKLLKSKLWVLLKRLFNL